MIRHYGITEEGNFEDHSHPEPLKHQNVLSIVDPKLTDAEQTLLASARMKMDAVRAKRVRLASQTEGRLAKTQLNEQRKAAGLERRMSYISRSVEKAAQEQDLIRSHQIRKHERKNSVLGIRSPLASQRSSVAGSTVVGSTLG